MELLHGSPKATRLRNGNRMDLFCGSMAIVCVLPTCYPPGVLIGAWRGFHSGIWQEHPLVSDPPTFLVQGIQTVT